MSAILKAQAVNVATVNSLKLIGVACHIYLGSNNVYPDKFWANAERIRCLNQSGIGTNSFEFLDYGTPLSTNTPDYFVLAREKQPRQNPDGKWYRDYLFVDGSVQQATTDDGNFDSWEQDWIQEAAQRAAWLAAQRAAHQSGPPVSR